jgi:HlyD family secretion protein
VIFRKVALERLSSPEQLDQLLHVTAPRSWLALAAIGLLLAGVMVWSVLGSVPTTAQGQGILIRQGGVSDLVSTADGPVREVLVAVGDEVERGQVVARLAQDELERQIREAEARLADLRSEQRDLEGYSVEQRRLGRRSVAQERANLAQSIETLRQEERLLAERRDSERDLLDDGLITKQTLLATEREINDVRDRLATQELALEGLNLDLLERDQQVGQLLEGKEAEVRDQSAELRELEARLAEDSVVRSVHAGRVLELAVDPGDLVTAGQSVLSLEVVSEELIAVLFVPAALGKQVSAEMGVRVSPSAVQREEYGYILGRVVRVAEFPSTSRGMMRLLSNEELVTSLMEDGPPIQVEVALEKDASTPSGYRWSSSRGPDLQITSGTLASGSIVIERERPIQLLIPGLRRQVGV